MSGTDRGTASIQTPGRFLRERIRDLDHDQILALETATYVPANKQETQDYEERGERLNALRRELIALMQKQQ